MKLKHNYLHGIKPKGQKLEENNQSVCYNYIFGGSDGIIILRLASVYCRIKNE